MSVSRNIKSLALSIRLGFLYWGKVHSEMAIFLALCYNKDARMEDE